MRLIGDGGLPTGLRTNHSPRGSAFLGLDELVVKPILLSTTHHGASSVIGYRVDVVGVPVQIGDGSIVLPRIEHDQIQ